MVGDALHTSPPVIYFLRPSWDVLQPKIANRPLSLGADVVSWDLATSEKFSVKSLYDKLTEGSALDIARGLWKAGLPLKIKIFLWQMFRNRLPTADNVAKRNGPSYGSCVVCGLNEDANHALFQCVLAKFVWSAIRDVFHQNWNPMSGSDLLAVLQTQKGVNARMLWRCVGALLWSLCTIQNKITIERKKPCSSGWCNF